MKTLSAPVARASRPEPISVVLLEFGLFPEVTPLNPRFVAGRKRVKLTLDVNLTPADEGGAPADLPGAVGRLLPGLARHHCCGDGGIQRAFLEGRSRDACAVPETDTTADAAHLLEHVVIDFQHHVADMDVCSGVTCGYENPRYRYDVFIESPARNVSRLCVALARNLMNELLSGEPPDPIYATAVRLAGAFYRDPGLSLNAATAARLLDRQAGCAAALRLLADAGFVHEIHTCINFSRVPVFALDRGGGREEQG